MPDVLPDIRLNFFIVQPLGSPGGESENEIRVAGPLPLGVFPDALGFSLGNCIFGAFPDVVIQTGDFFLRAIVGNRIKVVAIDPKLWQHHVHQQLLPNPNQSVVLASSDQRLHSQESISGA